MTRFASLALAGFGLGAFGLAIAPTHAAEFSASFDYEDGDSTIFGSFPSDTVTASNVASGSEIDYGTDEVPQSTYEVSPFSGDRMLQITESPLDGSNPAAVLGFVDNLNDGDTVTYSFRGFDPTDGRSPSILPNAVYTTGDDPNSFAGFATERQDFENFPGSGWLELTPKNGDGDPNPIVFEFGEPGEDEEPRDGIALRAQFFAPSAAEDESNPSSGDYDFFVDDLMITVDSTNPDARIVLPDGSVVVPEPASAALLGLGGIALIARRRRSA